MRTEAIAVCLLVAAACGSGDSKIDRLEKDIAREMRAALNVERLTVKCPEKLDEQYGFDCVATIEEQVAMPVAVRPAGEAGESGEAELNWRTKGILVKAAEVEQHIAAAVAGEAVRPASKPAPEPSPKIDCGARFAVVEEGDELTCRLQRDGAEPRQVIVTFTSKEGEATFRFE